VGVEAHKNTKTIHRYQPSKGAAVRHREAYPLDTRSSRVRPAVFAETFWAF
jgi:hypothetical protein